MNTHARAAIALLALATLTACERQPPATNTDQSPTTDATTPQTILAEAACGQCQFGMEGSSCDLAVRIDGTAYFVDGSNIDDHGDAHAADGLCNAVRPAEVTGTITEGRFVATSFKLTD